MWFRGNLLKKRKKCSTLQASYRPLIRSTESAVLRPLRCHPRASSTVEHPHRLWPASGAPCSRQPSANRSCRKSPLAKILDLVWFDDDISWSIYLSSMYVKFIKPNSSRPSWPVLTCIVWILANVAHEVCACLAFWRALSHHRAGDMWKQDETQKNDRTADVAASPERTRSIESFHQSGTHKPCNDESEFY